jgi:hypothetical protein
MDIPRFDTALLDRIERYVSSRTSGMIRDLHVAEANGHVVISGRSSTYYVKQLATHGAQAAAEGLALRNEVEVG